MLSPPTVEIPENYSSPDLEPRVFDDVAANGVHRKLADNAADSAPKNMTELYNFAGTLPKETLERLKNEANQAFVSLDPSARDATSVGAINLQLLLREKRVQEIRSTMTTVSAAAKTKRVIKKSESSAMPTQPTNTNRSVRRVVRKKPEVNPLASLQIDELSDVPQTPAIELSLVWNDPKNPDEQYTYVEAYHWVQLICEGNDVVQVLAVRDKRHASRYDSPKVPFSTALPATLTITDGGVSDTFGVMSGIFQFEFGVFDFCLFLVIN